MVDPAERTAQLTLARQAAAEAGRDPDALEYTRMGSIRMTVERAEQLAAEGVTRVVVGSSATDPAQQRDEMSAFAQRFHLSP